MNTQEPCPRIEALSALMDGELGEPDRMAVQAHADRCPVCAPVLAEFRHLHARFAALDSSTPDFDLAPEVDRRIGAAIGAGLGKPTPPSRPARAPWWQLALLAPGGAAAVSVGLWLGAALPAAVPSAQAAAVQMVPFSTVPAGALCPVPRACGGFVR
jgi:anti-sigma factor RsiW